MLHPALSPRIKHCRAALNTAARRCQPAAHALLPSNHAQWSSANAALKFDMLCRSATQSQQLLAHALQGGRGAHPQRASSKPRGPQHPPKSTPRPLPLLAAAQAQTFDSPENFPVGSSWRTAQPKWHQAGPYSAAPSKQGAWRGQPALPLHFTGVCVCEV